MDLKQWEEVPVKNFGHVFSDGGAADIPFRDDCDKVFAMNLSARLGFSCGVDVLCQEVIETHLHSVIHGEPDNCRHYVAELHRQLICHYKRAGKADLLGKGLFVNILPIETRTSLMNRIVYVMRQVLDTGYPYLPQDYHFGPGNIYLVSEETIRANRAAGGAIRRIGDMRYRERYMLFRTHVRLPEDWLVDESGLILPSCYLRYDMVNDLFKTPRSFIAFLHIKKDNDEQIRQLCRRRQIESLTLKDLREKAEALCRSWLGKSLRQASVTERLKTASRMIRDGYAFQSAALAKAVFLSPEDLSDLLHR